MTDDDTLVVSYAQNREDVILSGFFAPDKTGFYVDVGAHDPVTDSVTKYFYDRGWTGINIEPLPEYHERLVAARPRDTNLRIAVAEQKGTASLREYTNGTGLSTLSDATKRTLAAGDEAVARTYRDFTVDTLPLKSIFKSHDVINISFMKVDVEGYEYPVLKSNDWKKYRPEVLCIEADHIVQDWRPLLKEAGYEKVFFDGLNEYYVDGLRPEVRQRFSYVMAVPFREPVVNHRLLPKLQNCIALQQRVRDLEEEVAMKSAYAVHLERSISEITPLRRHIRRQLKMRLRGIDSRVAARLQSGRQYMPDDIKIEHDMTTQQVLSRVVDADSASFARYNRSTKQSFGLRLYRALRRFAIGIISRLLRLRKV